MRTLTRRFPRFMSLRDIGLFRQSAVSDARLRRIRAAGAAQGEAFDQLYTETANDPWGSGSPRYFYQRNKYDAIVRALPAERRFRRALDAGCGAGHLARRLAARSDEVIGVDVSAIAVGEARRLSAGAGTLSFETADLRALPTEYDGRFDLVVIADAIYYLPEICLTAGGIAELAARYNGLLAPDGLLLLVNHYFCGLDADSRLSRRIDDGFRASPRLRVVRGWRRPFWIASLFAGVA